MKQFSIGNSLFGLTNYPNRNNAWSLRRQFEETVKKGYTHFEGDFGSLDHKVVRNLAAEYELTLGYIRFGIRSQEDMRRLIEDAKQVEATYLVVIAGRSYDSVDKSVQLLGELMEMSKSAGIPFYLETHRDSITQDLTRCVEIIRQLPSVPLMVDMSHMLVAGEITEGLYEEYDDWFTPILERTVGFHGRISNGNQIQIGIHNINDQHIQRFSRFWIAGLEQWKKKTDQNPFRFTIELGPPAYSLTHWNKGEETEMYDRLEQGDLLAALFGQCWNKVFQ